MNKLVYQLMSALVFLALTFGSYASAGAASAPIVAFPGAEGFGSQSVGGRGGKIIEVTNLNDSGLGSLRDAVENQSGPRIVVFKISGVIQSNSVVYINNPYITIAGQTAPGSGIVVKGSGLSIRTHDVIIRGMKMRIGDGVGATPSDRDGITAYGDATHKIYNIIVDHNSISWGVDENTSVYDESNNANSVTFSWNIISEALRCSIHVDEGATTPGCHSMGLLIESPQGNISIHHNLFASNYDRNPGIQSGNVEFYNNVIYNWGIHATSVTGGNLNAVGNTYINTAGSSKWIGPGVTSIHCEANPGKIYLSGNVGPGGNDWNTLACNGIPQSQVRSDVPAFVGSGITATSAEQAYIDLLARAGSLRDEIDSRVVAYVESRATPAAGWWINSQSEVGGWMPVSGAAPIDNDHDGMPDGWEVEHSLNPASAADANAVAPSGYTWIEEYLNSFFSAQSQVAPNPTPTSALPIAAITESPVVAASANTYYVSVNGSDTGAGTQSAPFKTVQKCLNVVAAGNTCLVTAGTYNEALTLKTSGTSSLPITIKCETAKACIVNSGNAQTLGTGNHINYYTIDGMQFIAAAVTSQATLYFGQGTIWSKDNKTLGNNGFILRNCYVEGDVKFYGHNNLVENCEFNGKNTWNNGITDGYATSYDNVYRNNTIYDYKVRSIWTMQYTDNILIEGNNVNRHIDCDGAGHPVTRCYVRNNIIHDAEMGIQIENSFDSIFEGNTIYNVRFGMLIENYGIGPDFNADAEYRDTNSNIIVRNNLIYNASSNGIYVYGASGGKITNNTIQYTIAGSGYYGAIALAKYGAYYSRDWEVKNNIFSSKNVSFLFVSPPAGLSGFVSDYNFYEGAKFIQRIDNTFNNRTVAQWQAMGLDLHSGFADPLFVNSAAGDFHLQSNSSACTGGENGAYIGAFPCGVISPTNTPVIPSVTPSSAPSVTPTELLPTLAFTPTPTPQPATTTATPAPALPTATETASMPTVVVTATSIPVDPTFTLTSEPPTSTVTPTIQPVETAPVATSTSVAAASATYYVSVTGNDANAGTSETVPWKTISKVNSWAFQPGDSVLFKRGDTWALNSGGEAGSLVVTSSGMTFGAYGTGNLPLFNGANMQDSGVMWKGMVILDNVSYVTIENLDLYNAIKQHIGIGGGGGNSNHITVQNCTIRTNRTNGFMNIFVKNNGAQGSTNNIVIRNNRIYDSKWDGMRITGGVTNVTISGNEIHQVLHNGIDTHPNNGINNKDFEISNNNIYDFGGGAGAGIYNPGASYFNIHDNDIHDSTPGTKDTYGIKVGSEAGYVMDNITVRANRIWNVNTNNNNTYGLWFNACTDCGAINNTVYANTSALLNLSNTNFQIVNNLAYANVRDQSSMKNYAQDPKFINAAAGDFHLQPDSPACGTGAFPCEVVLVTVTLPSASTTPLPTATPTASLLPESPTLTWTNTPVVPSVTPSSVPSATPTEQIPTLEFTPTPTPQPATPTETPAPMLPTATETASMPTVVVTASLDPASPTETASPIPVDPAFTQTSEPPISTVEPTTQPASETIYDDKDGAFVYSAGWKDVIKEQAYNGSYKLTTRKNSFVTFTFSGQSFSILYKGGPTFRKMDVYVDDVLVDSVNENTSSSSFQQRWDYAGQLATGNHTLKLVFVTPKRTNSTNGSIDAVIVR